MYEWLCDTADHTRRQCRSRLIRSEDRFTLSNSLFIKNELHRNTHHPVRSEDRYRYLILAFFKFYLYVKLLNLMNHNEIINTQNATVLFFVRQKKVNVFCHLSFLCNCVIKHKINGMEWHSFFEMNLLFCLIIYYK